MTSDATTLHTKPNLTKLIDSSPPAWRGASPLFGGWCARHWRGSALGDGGFGCDQVIRLVHTVGSLSLFVKETWQVWRLLELFSYAIPKFPTIFPTLIGDVSRGVFQWGPLNRSSFDHLLLKQKELFESLLQQPSSGLTIAYFIRIWLASNVRRG